MALITSGFVSFRRLSKCSTRSRSIGSTASKMFWTTGSRFACRCFSGLPTVPLPACLYAVHTRSCLCPLSPPYCSLPRSPASAYRLSLLSALSLASCLHISPQNESIVSSSARSSYGAHSQEGTAYGVLLQNAYPALKKVLVHNTADALAKVRSGACGGYVRAARDMPNTAGLCWPGPCIRFRVRFRARVALGVFTGGSGWGSVVQVVDEMVGIFATIQGENCDLAVLGTKFMPVRRQESN